MKKRKVLGAIAGVVAIAIAAGASYAWFVSTDTQDVTITAAKINAEFAEEIVFELTDEVLPNQTITEDDQKIAIVNNSTREALVRITLAMDEDNSFEQLYDPNDEFTLDDGTTYNDRRDELIGLFNGALNVNFGLTQDEIDNTKMEYAEINGKHYYFLPDNNILPEALDGQGFELIIPKELGGNVATRDIDGNITNSTPDRQLEHKSKIQYIYKVEAVQASDQAIMDFFADDYDEIIAAFGVDGDMTNPGVLLDF